MRVLDSELSRVGERAVLVEIAAVDGAELGGQGRFLPRRVPHGIAHAAASVSAREKIECVCKGEDRVCLQERRSTEFAACLCVCGVCGGCEQKEAFRPSNVESSGHSRYAFSLGML